MMIPRDRVVERRTMEEGNPPIGINRIERVSIEMVGVVGPPELRIVPKSQRHISMVDGDRRPTRNPNPRATRKKNARHEKNARTQDG
jgi:hypothetical protein